MTAQRALADRLRRELLHGELSPRLAERAREVLAGRLEPAVPRLAASVVLARDGVDGIEVFALQRRTELAFAGGTMVFPGGALEPDDADAGAAQGPRVARALGVPEDLAGAIVGCAVRETHEEAGVLLDPLALTPLACWTTPACEPLRFRAWFLGAHVPDGQEPVADATEAVSGDWVSVRAALRAYGRGELAMWPPQFFTLCAAAAHASAADWLGAKGPVPWHEPQLEIVDDEPRLARDPALYAAAIAALDAVAGPR